MDIADLLIRQYRREHISIIPVEEEKDPMKNPAFLKMKEYVDIENAEEVAMLIEDLGLEVMGYKSLDNKK